MRGDAHSKVVSVQDCSQQRKRAPTGAEGASITEFAVTRRTLKAMIACEREGQKLDAIDTVIRPSQKAA
jgi:hypothetical protein